jgi:CheY-like chemotaxis protein
MTPPTESRALVVDADPAVFSLLDEWLAEQGFRVSEEPPRGDYDLIVVDVPFPRLGAPEFLRHLAREHPGTPILALSSSFFAGVDASGAVAKALGVSAVLSKPVTRDGLANAVKKILAQAA